VAAPRALVQVSFMSGNTPLQPTQLKALERNLSLAAIYAATKPANALGLNFVAYSGTPAEGFASWVLLGIGIDPAELTLDDLYGLGDVKRLKFDCVNAAAVPAAASSSGASGDDAPVEEQFWHAATKAYRTKPEAEENPFETMRRALNTLTVPAKYERPAHGKQKLYELDLR
jgi:hypothetical protein